MDTIGPPTGQTEARPGVRRELPVTAARDVADFQTVAVARGFTHNYALDKDSRSLELMKELRLVESRSFDSGTDPGDDATIYLIESTSGRNGYLIVSDSFHADPGKVAFIDALLAAHRGKQ